jgi:hypothetical protein
MGTRSQIGYVKPNKVIVTAYCHWDGYVEGVGKTLLTNFDSYELAQSLVDKGSMSSCGEGYYGELPTEYKNRREYNSEFAKDIFAEYHYLHDGKKWIYRGSGACKWKDLTRTLVLELLQQ